MYRTDIQILFLHGKDQPKMYRTCIKAFFLHENYSLKMYRTDIQILFLDGNDQLKMYRTYIKTFFLHENYSLKFTEQISREKKLFCIVKTNTCSHWPLPLILSLHSTIHASISAVNVFCCVIRYNYFTRAQKCLILTT